MKRGRVLLLFCCLLFPQIAFALDPAKAPFESKNYHKKEVLLRISPEFGLMGKMRQTDLDLVIKRFVIENADGNLEIQFAEHWFASFSFHYSHLRGKHFNGFIGDGHIYAATGGVKLVSSTNYPSTGEFFDDTRWWFGMEFGPYFTAFTTRLRETDQDGTNLGVKTGAGFDYFFGSHWASGLHMNLHYSKFHLDDYILFTFGPHLVWKF